MNNLSKEKKQQLILIGIMTIGIMSGLWFALISPQQKSRQQIAKKTAGIQDQVGKADKLVKKSSEIADRLSVVKTELDAKHEGMSGADPFLWFITLMNKYVTVNATKYPSLANFQTVNYTREPVEVGLLPQFPYKAVVFTVQMVGNYQDFGRFLADFENDWPYLRVQNVNLRLPAAVPTDEKLDITFEVVALRAPGQSNTTK